MGNFDVIFFLALDLVELEEIGVNSADWVFLEFLVWEEKEVEFLDVYVSEDLGVSPGYFVLFFVVEVEDFLGLFFSRREDFLELGLVLFPGFLVFFLELERVFYFLVFLFILVLLLLDKVFFWFFFFDYVWGFWRTVLDLLFFLFPN